MALLMVDTDEGNIRIYHLCGKCEKEIQELYSIWRERFPRKSDHELLAMIAYQYASYYRDLLKIHKQAVAMADECNSEARRMLSL